jgi:hypothetical protein
MHPMGARRADQLERLVRLGAILNPNLLLNYHAAARSVKMFDAVVKSGLMQAADLVLLDRDILACEDKDVARTRVLLTVVGGEVVYER